MSSEQQPTSFRLPVAILGLLDRLAGYLADAEGKPLSRAAVVRLALRELAKRHGIADPVAGNGRQTPEDSEEGQFSPPSLKPLASVAVRKPRRKTAQVAEPLEAPEPAPETTETPEPSDEEGQVQRRTKSASRKPEPLEEPVEPSEPAEPSPSPPRKPEPPRLGYFGSGPPLGKPNRAKGLLSSPLPLVLPGFCRRCTQLRYAACPACLKLLALAEKGEPEPAKPCPW